MPRRIKREIPVSKLRGPADLESEESELTHDEWLDAANLQYEQKMHVTFKKEGEELRDKVSRRLEGDDLEIDWDALAELAGLDSEERLVMKMKVFGYSREGALRMCVTEEDRRILQAAWRRFQDHLEDVATVLRSGMSHRIRRIGEKREGLKPVFSTGPDGRMKIFFQKHLPEGGKKGL